MSSNEYLPDTVAELVEQLNLIPHPEGGFFLETYRSGSTPMSSRGQSDLDVKEHCLVTVSGRDDCRPDKSKQRNCITSIYWVPTSKSPSLPLTANLSDHVHYYQGGKPFRYHIYSPATATVRTLILGPNIKTGHFLQVPVVSGEWKCGRLVDEDCETIKADYCIVAEAVGPGFDFHDFHWVSKTELEDSKPSDEVKKLLTPFLYELQGVTKEEEFDGHYKENAAKKKRTAERV